MTPRARVAAASLAFTIAAMYLVIRELAPLVQAASLPQNISAGVLAVLASGGLYGSINRAATRVILTLSPVKRLFFGASYLEDTWVGFYEEPDGDRCLLVEVFEQDFEGITIKGESFDEAGRRRAQWVSESVAFNEREGTLRYFYTCHVLADKKIQQGVTDFNVRRDGPTGVAELLDGYSSDLHDGHRAPAWEARLTGTRLSLETTLRAARSHRDAVLTARDAAAI